MPEKMSASQSFHLRTKSRGPLSHVPAGTYGRGSGRHPRQRYDIADPTIDCPASGQKCERTGCGLRACVVAAHLGRLTRARLRLLLKPFVFFGPSTPRDQLLAAVRDVLNGDMRQALWDRLVKISEEVDLGDGSDWRGGGAATGFGAMAYGVGVEGQSMQVQPVYGRHRK